MSEATLAAVSVLGLLNTGAASALLRKVMFQMPGVGLGGQMHTFKKPFFTTLDSAVACSTGLLVHCLHLYSARRRLQAQQQSIMQQSSTEDGEQNDALQKPLMVDETDESFLAKVAEAVDDVARFRPISRSLAWKLLWPALFGRCALITQGMGLKYVSASMNQMIAASCIVFTAVLSVTFLKRKLNMMHVSGILLVLCGVAMVSFAHPIYTAIAGDSAPACAQLATTTAAQLEPLSAGTHASLDLRMGCSNGVTESKHHHPHHHASPRNLTIGIALILLSQLIQAGQLILEEVLLGGEEALAPMEVIGWEGLLATGWMLLLFLPLAQLLPGADVGGVQENTLDSIIMLARNADVFVWNAVYFLTVAGTNLFGLLVAAYLGSVFRAVLLAGRTAVVWAAALAIHALNIGGGTYGEVWEADSWITLAGFLLLLCGTVLYAQGSSKVVKVAELHPEDAPLDVVQRLDTYALTLGNRSMDDLGLFDDVIDKQSWDQNRHHVLGGSPVASRSSSRPIDVQQSLQPDRPISLSLIDEAERLGIHLSARTASLLHGSSWVKDADDRQAAWDAAERSALPRRPSANRLLASRQTSRLDA